ncbi:LacI family DNA-binding transcriptional regulator [Streptomyces sp. NPDC002920]
MAPVVGTVATIFLICSWSSRKFDGDHLSNSRSTRGPRRRHAQSAAYVYLATRSRWSAVKWEKGGREVKKVTGFDVARRAGVSQPTVSRALRNLPGTSQETARECSGRRPSSPTSPATRQDRCPLGAPGASRWCPLPRTRRASAAPTGRARPAHRGDHRFRAPGRGHRRPRGRFVRRRDPHDV